jgi:hypothetical protein
MKVKFPSQTNAALAKMKLEGQGISATFDTDGDVLHVADADLEAVIDSIFDDEGLYGAQIEEEEFDD